MLIVPIPSRESLGLATTDSPAFAGVSMAIDGTFYIGDVDTNGSYRILIVDGELEIQKRVGGSWTYKARF